MKGIVGIEIYASGYRPFGVVLSLADVHDYDPLAALEHVPQGLRVDVALRYSPAPRSGRPFWRRPAGAALAASCRLQATLTAGSTPSPAPLPQAPSGRWAPCSAAVSRTRRPRPPKRRGLARPGRRPRGTGSAWRSRRPGWRSRPPR